MSHTVDAVNQIETERSLSFPAAISSPVAALVNVAGSPVKETPRWTSSPLMSYGASRHMGPDLVAS